MTAHELEAALELVHPSRRKAAFAMLMAASAGLPYVAIPAQTFAGTNSAASVARDGDTITLNSII